MSPVRRAFDSDFFHRYYLDPATAVVMEDEVVRLARFVLSYLDFLGVEVESVLDVGCGVGLWKRALGRLRRRVEYVGLDTSPFVARRYGWIDTPLPQWKTRRRFDLVVLQDVMQYMRASEVDETLEAVARRCRGALYVDVPTREDFEEGTLDLRRTDRNIHVRSVRWYRRRLRRHFVSAGGGVFLPHRARTTLLALERLE